ncbi:dephospho-CoA kinase [uncultured Helicobacter sp.]|uniref:dephospho-CoA kinase n=1 Tax=uncultured Helicobacter sp. TaxID=175537 RepID=UPI00374ECD73
MPTLLDSIDSRDSHTSPAVAAPQNLHYGIALTGCIGSGKSSVSAILKAKGYVVLCADEVAHRILQESASEVAQAFGAECVRDGVVDRKALGAIVFGDKRARLRLESLLHPKIRKRLLANALALESTHRWYFLDIPLFFESGGRESYPVSKVALVYAPKEQCLARILKRDRLDRESAQARINAQMDIEQKRVMSDYIIDNTGDKEALEGLVGEVLERLER